MYQEPIVESAIVKSKRTTAVIIGLVSVLFFACAFGVYNFFEVSFKRIHVAIAVGDKFLDLEKAHNFVDAHDLLAPSAQTATSIASMTQIQSLIERSHGSIIKYSKPSILLREDNSVSNIRLSYRTTFTKGFGSVHLIVVETPNGWKIYSYNFSL